LLEGADLLVPAIEWAGVHRFRMMTFFVRGCKLRYSSIIVARAPSRK